MSQESLSLSGAQPPDGKTKDSLAVDSATTGLPKSLDNQPSCHEQEPWGESIYLLDAGIGIRHYVRRSDSDQIQFVRAIATQSDVALCVVMEHALVYVSARDGVYQVARGIEENSESLWLAEIPLGFDAKAYFEKTDEHLFLVTHKLDVAFKTPIIIDRDVRNVQIPYLVPTTEINLSLEAGITGAPYMELDSRLLLQTTKGVYEFVSNPEGQLETQVVTANLEVIDDRLRVIVLPDNLIELQIPKLVGHCSSQNHIVAYDSSGLLRSYKIERSVEQSHLLSKGSFTLTSGIRTCLLDDQAQRLYVLSNDLVLWVFDLSVEFLEMPRSVTTDQAFGGLRGLALFNSQYVITQSQDDGVFLVFDTKKLVLKAQFRIDANITGGIDGVKASRGFAIWAEPLPNMPRGALIVHDERNRLPPDNENMKLIDWLAIEQLIHAELPEE